MSGLFGDAPDMREHREFERIVNSSEPPSWLQGSLAGFDLETSGVDVENDRIVTACVGFAKQPGDWTPRRWLVNPGVEIPEDASAVHGITNEIAAQGQPPAEAVASIALSLETAWGNGAPVIGFNVIYDLTLLDREMRRHLGRPLEIAGPVLDGLVIDKAIARFRKGSRKLTAVCEHYGIPLDDAHTADADAFAAVRLVWTMINNDSALSVLTLDQLHDQQISWYGDQRRSFNQYLTSKGETPDDLNTVWPLAPFRLAESRIAS